MLRPPGLEPCRAVRALRSVAVGTGARDVGDNPPMTTHSRCCHRCMCARATRAAYSTRHIVKVTYLPRHKDRRYTFLGGAGISKIRACCSQTSRAAAAPRGGRGRGAARNVSNRGRVSRRRAAATPTRRQGRGGAGRGSPRPDKADTSVHLVLQSNFLATRSDFLSGSRNGNFANRKSREFCFFFH